uniref:Uncharacterized protein n=1 Tax=Melopsittacus undulatus TaxID=13146 RepID=A0A8C6NFD6_MELUD
LRVNTPVEADRGTQLATGRGPGPGRPSRCPLTFHGRARSRQAPAAGVQPAPPAPRRGPRELPRYGGAASELLRAAAPGTEALGPAAPRLCPVSPQLSVMKGELGEADKLLHEALRLSHQSDNRKAITYTYSMVRLGRLAEKLYKASMSYLLSGDTKEVSLLCSVVALCRHKLALAGYEFCILTLEEKIAKQKDLPEDVLPAEEKANTRLLLGMSLDSYARYLLNINQLPAAQKMYEKALEISKDVQGETHAQTVVLMSDLATVLDAQGHHDEAYSYVKRAAELAKETQHPEEHMVLSNLAAILMHKKDFLQAKQVYKEALKQAQQKGDVASVQHIQEELAELAKRRKGSK